MRLASTIVASERPTKDGLRSARPERRSDPRKTRQPGEDVGSNGDLDCGRLNGIHLPPTIEAGPDLGLCDPPRTRVAGLALTEAELPLVRRKGVRGSALSWIAFRG